MNYSQAEDMCYRLMNETDYEFHVQDACDKVAIFSEGISVYISWTIDSNMFENDIKRFIERLEDRGDIKVLERELTRYKTMGFFSRLKYLFSKTIK